jgi:outer membrane protein insertion porin family
MKTKRHWWGSWLSGSGVLKDDQFQEDLDKVREYYRSHGYIDVEVRGTKVERVSRKWLVVHLDLFEGRQYKIGSVQIEGTRLFPVADIQKKLKMTGGQTFTPDGLQKDSKAIEDYYGGRGYLDTSVRSVRVPNVQTGRMDVTYTVKEGELTYIEKIEIRGNTKTKDKVLRRELAVAPGDIYDTVRVTKSAERLKNLGYFAKVDTTPEPTAVPNRKNLVVNVEEQRTGTLTFGAGFSSIDSLVGFVEVTQGNFDLFNWPTFTGGGQKLRMRAQVGLQRQDYILSFTEPWFLDRQLSLGFDAFYREAGYLSSDYTEKRVGGDVRLGKAINQFLRWEVQYSLQDIAQSITATNISQELLSQSGTWLRSSLLTTLTYDTRDSVFLTMRGNRSELSGELVGGPLGGNVSIYKLNARTTFFFPFFNGHVLELIGAAGVADAYGSSRGSGPTVTETVVNGGVTNFVPVKVDDVPLFDRYFLGGANTLRGFDYRKVGPKDINSEPIGGNTYVNATVEYSIPVVERVRFALFFDVGEVERNAYQFAAGDLMGDVGGGVRLNLPVGPLRLDYGWPIITDGLSGRTGKIQFSVGYQF